MSATQQPPAKVSLAELLEAASLILSAPMIIFVNGNVAVINADAIYDPFPEKKEAEDAHGSTG